MARYKDSAVAHVKKIRKQISREVLKAAKQGRMWEKFEELERHGME